jgi:hypothetical protein
MRLWTVHPRYLDPRGLVSAIHAEATARRYAFDAAKVGPVRVVPKIPATTGQVVYEWRHLLKKLAVRNPEWCHRWRDVRVPQLHPLFEQVDGPRAPWERGLP